MEGMWLTQNRQNMRSFRKFLAGNPTWPPAPVAASFQLKLRDSKASTECNYEVGENEYGVCKTRDGQTSVTYGQNW